MMCRCSNLFPSSNFPAAKRVLLLLLAQLVISCSVFQGWISPADERFHAYLAQHQYKRALMLANAQHEKAVEKESADKAEKSTETNTESNAKLVSKESEAQSSQWSSNIALALSKAERYLGEQIAVVEQLQKEEDWGQARERVRFLARNIPEDDALRIFLEEFEGRRVKRIEVLERSLLLLGTQTVPEAIELFEKLNAVDDSPETKALLKHLLQKRQELLIALNQRLELAESNADYHAALTYARAIQRIDDSPGVLDRISALREKTIVRNQVRSANSKAAEQKESQQLSDYGKAVVEKRWVDARELLDQMLNERPHDGELQGQDTYLKEVFQKQVSSARESGEQLYAEGKIEEALAVWQSVLKMAPNDLQLATNIQRAQRILAKVQELKSVDQQKIKTDQER